MEPLRIRSYYSLLRGTASPAVLCRRAKAFGYRCLALTDRDNLYGLWPFVDACRHEGIRPIIGAELSVGAKAPGSIVALVEDDVGYANLCRLITRARYGKDGDDRFDPERWRGLTVLTRETAVLELFLERGVNVAADLGSRPTEAGSRLRRRARELGLSAVATPDSDLADGDDQALFQLVNAIGSGTMLADSGRDNRPGAGVVPLERPQVYCERFAVWPDALRAADDISERCAFSGPRFGIVMPPWRGDGRCPAVVLRELAYRGARRRYGDDLSEAVVERLEHELLIIGQMGFDSYFLVVRSIVKMPVPGGSPGPRRICGRGSGAASLVAYCLGITNVCPIRYNLYFERFLNPGRSDPPDIDIDFAWDERDTVLGEVFRRFGTCAAMVSNHVCFQPRMAIRETARAWGIPGGEISRLTKRLPWFYRDESGDLQEQLAALPSLQDHDFPEPWGDIIPLAVRLIGTPRCLSVHPGGVVITPAPVSSYVPVEPAVKGVPIIQWEKEGAEAAGLVKIDLLGNRSLGVIRDAVTALRGGGVSIAEKTWQPEHDSATQAAIGRGETMGCFYIESPAMRLLQRKAGSGDFEQVVIQSSIIRPAANEFVREYVRRLHGGSWHPLHPQLELVLDETYGLMVYQEDVSRVAVALAGFTHAEADGLRKVLSKKDRQRRLRDYRSAFDRGCRENNIEAVDADRIWEMMMSFDGYSFCKPHSASYARVSFQAVYLKVHAPAEFMAAVISNQGGYYSTFAYVSEAKRMGLTIDPPDVTCSGCHWSGQGLRVRVGLQAIRGMSGATAEHIVACRGSAPFSNLEDFIDRVRPEVDELRMMIDAGALDSLNPGGNRSVLHWQAAGAAREKKRAAAGLLFGVLAASPPPKLPPPSMIERLRREYRALGFLCRHHPLCLIGYNDGNMVKAVDLATCVGRSVKFAGWLLAGKLVTTKAGDAMEFLTFEDETGLVETTFFPQTYRRYAHLLTGNRPYLLHGLVESDYGALTLTVDRIQPLRR